MSIDKANLEKLLDDLYCEAYCPDCHHGDNLEIPNAERVIEEAYRLGRESLKNIAYQSWVNTHSLTDGLWLLIRELYPEASGITPIPKTPCELKICDYYRHYLAHGPADLTHEGFHQADKTCLKWQELVRQTPLSRRLCPVCGADIAAWESPEGFGTPHDCKVQP